MSAQRTPGPDYLSLIHCEARDRAKNHPDPAVRERSMETVAICEEAEAQIRLDDARAFARAVLAKLAPVEPSDPDIRQGRYSPDDNFIFPGRS